jgi:hypothetical protein
MRLPFAKVLWMLATLCFLGIRPARASEWRSIDLPSRPMNITQNDGTLWVCGADQLIASSTDGGKSWASVHFAKNGGVLLNMGFADERFGYAAGTGGALVLTTDGGKTWVAMKAPTQVIYDVSFSDEKHGLIQTPRAIYATSDGGHSWASVTVDFGSPDFKGFSYVSAILALDAKHMMIVLSEGNAAYFSQKFLNTKDGGLTWKAIDIPSTGLTRLTKHGGEYWFAGMEVIDKDKPGGGHSVPLLMHSADGEEWTHLPRSPQKEFSACKTEGCLYWDGAGVELPPANPVQYWTFPAEKLVTAKWDVAQEGICSVGTDLKCASLTRTETMPPYTKNSSPIPTLIFAPALDAPASPGLQCISCDADRLIVTSDYQGVAQVELKVYVAENGLVDKIEIVSATKPEIGERMAATARTWVFVPYEKDGAVHPVVTNVKLSVQAIKSK